MSSLVQTRNFHKWAGVLMGPLILIAAGTALGLNHSDVVRGEVFRAVPEVPGPFGKAVLSTAVAAGAVWVGTNDGLFRSDDGGKTFADVALPVPAKRVGAIAFDPAHPATGYVALRRTGVFGTTDGGKTWAAVALPFEVPGGNDLVGLALAADGGLLVTTPRGMWAQAGGTWTEIPAAALPDEAAKSRVSFIHDLHEGHTWGTFGVPVTDAAAIALLCLTGTGYWLAWKTRRRKRVSTATVPTHPRPDGHPRPSRAGEEIAR